MCCFRAEEEEDKIGPFTTAQWGVIGIVVSIISFFCYFPLFEKTRVRCRKEEVFHLRSTFSFIFLLFNW